MRYVDVFSGTSVGSQLALSYASGHTPLDIYCKFPLTASRIFKRGLRKYWPFGPSYSDKILNNILRESLPGMFTDYKPCFIPVYNYPARTPLLLQNIGQGPGYGMEAWEVARASSAAPTYFAPWNGMIDGGWWCNNPALMSSLAITDRMNVSLKDIDLLIVGTGNKDYPGVCPAEMREWSVWKWLRPVIEGVTISNEQGTEWACGHMPFKSFRVFDPYIIPEEFRMDQPWRIPDIMMDIEEYQEEFEEVWSLFIK